ncbi:serine carboxypeptidase [Trifolium repens]|nr:serine carboxypeptidase [Trifolium repens]
MKKCWIVGVLIVVSLLGTKIGVEGYPIEDLVVRLPSQPKVEFKQYAGYVDIDVKHERSFFYYFVEADHDPHKKPLTLWLNGGPGCSSLGGGAFTELVSARFDLDSTSYLILDRENNFASNLLFVESPVGVGWSYSNTTSDYNTGDASTANDMLCSF